jgi:RNA polymerase sigma-70 factor (ECF subfamily)
MLRVAAGDESCFNFLVEKYHRAMIHFLFRMVRNQAIAEELAQEVFLRVYRSRESYRAEAKFTTWLYRIATNLAVNRARYQARAGGTDPLSGRSGPGDRHHAGRGRR